MSLEQNAEKYWFFVCWYKFMVIKSWLNNIVVGMFKNRCGYSNHRTPKLAVSHEGINRMNWFFVLTGPNLDLLYASSYRTLPPFVKNMQSFIVMENTSKRNWIGGGEIAGPFLSKKSPFWPKLHLLGHETLKSAASQEWIDEMSWFFACWYKFRKAKGYFIKLHSKWAKRFRIWDSKIRYIWAYS